MSCFKKNCTIKRADDAAQPQFVYCWLCDNIMHAKCAGLSGRDCDKLIAASKKECGVLNWSCPVCIEKQIDFSRMYNSVRNQFLKLSKAAKLLSSDFDSSVELLSQFKFDSPPDPQFLAVPSNDLINRSPSTPLASRQHLDATPTLSLSPSPGTSNLFSPAPSGAVIVTAPIADSAHIIESSMRAGSGRKARPPINSVRKESGNIEVPHLNVVAPRKQIFVSRLSSDTTCESVAAYISSKTPASVSITKFNFSTPREISSFKISVPNDSFAVICDPKFWPPHMIVHEFKPKRRSEPVALPAGNSSPQASTSNAPKN